jgi:hypothetical protein
MQHQRFFPRRGVLLFTINRKGVMAFASHDDFGKASTKEPFSQRLRDKPGVHGQRKLRKINTFTDEFRF